MKSITPVWQFLAGFVLGALVMLGASVYTDIPAQFTGDNSIEDTTTENVEGQGNDSGDPQSPSTATTSDSGDTDEIFGPLPSETTAEVIVEPQVAGSRVLIEHVVMPEDGWVVVHEVLDGHISNALGAVRRDPGEHEDVVVELLRSTIPQGTYVVVLYSDNGNGEFELNSDLPIVDSFGEALIQEFTTIPATPN